MLWSNKDLRWKEGVTRRIELLEQKVIKNFDRSYVVSCEGCGCLLYKSAMCKQPSTIIAAAAYLYPYSHSFGSAKTEHIVEHYLCGRCSPKKAEGEMGREK